MPPSGSKSTAPYCARPLFALLVLGSALASVEGAPWRSTGRGIQNPNAAVALALEARGLHTRPENVRWIDPPSESWMGPWGKHRFAAIVKRGSEPQDVWLGAASLSPEGRFIGLARLYNLSDSSAVSENTLVVAKQRLAWTVNDESEVVAVKVVDLKGQTLSNSAMTWLERLQTRITFLQETGQFSGLCQKAYRFDGLRSDVVMGFTEGGLSVESRGQRGLLRCDGGEIAPLGMVAEPSELGNPGDLVNWAVDRVRALPWFGADRMQWLKAVVFGLLDRVDTLRRHVIAHDGSEQLAAQLGDFLSAPSTGSSNPATGWPPSPMAPLLSPPLQSEGVFRSLDDDPFALPPEGKTSPFALGYLRPDSTRPESQVFVVVWDPRLVELHTMTGTREPKTATGETGSGMVPRADATIGRLAAAFNGGFQATHGEFGMMAERVVYLPPKPFAATIAEMADGTVGFGTWPEDETIPQDVIGFRQNLTPLIADATINPYGRTWWGGVPPGWHDATRTVRTGLCLTREHFVAYFYGSTLSADHLAKAMMSARCDYGVHLDMNPGHTGFEFYRVQKTGTLPVISRKLDSTWEARGTVTGTSGWEFLGRRMLRTMHLMHFPRYIRTDSRDFFYLTHRQVLPPKSPDSPESTPEAARDPWQTDNLSQHGSPAAVSTRRLRPDPTRPELEIAAVVLDGKWATPCTVDCNDSKSLLRTRQAGVTSGVGVYYVDRKFLVTETTPPASAIPIAFGRNDRRAGRTAAALGIVRREWLVYVEVIRGGDRQRDALNLEKLLSQMQCEQIVYLEQPLGVVLGAGVRATNRHSVSWVRDESPMARRILSDTPVVPPAAWQPIQAKRVRYKRQPVAVPNTRPVLPAGSGSANGPAVIDPSERAEQRVVE